MRIARSLRDAFAPSGGDDRSATDRAEVLSPSACASTLHVPRRLMATGYGAANRRSPRIADGARAAETLAQRKKPRTGPPVQEPKRGKPLLHRRSNDAVSCKSCAVDHSGKPATHAIMGPSSNRRDGAHPQWPDAAPPPRALLRGLDLGQ